MANQREIKNRIISISNTTKITSTMEMISTAKMKKMQQRLNQSKPFAQKINGVITRILSTGNDISNNALFNEVANPQKSLLVVVSGNRGLCGSYNSHIVAHSLSFKENLEASGKQVNLFVIGKKGIGLLNFLKIPILKQEVNKEDKFTFDDAAELSEEIMQSFLTGVFDEIYIAYTGVVSTSSHVPLIQKVLPLTFGVDSLLEVGELSKNLASDFIFEPGPESLISYIIPLFLKISLYSAFIESTYSEQFARRVAMKNATDASLDMIKELKITYNRARQAKITNEIAEIVGGAAALG